jgi:hypothetical protein
MLSAAALNRYCRICVVSLCLAATTGCASFALRPATPAKDLDASKVPAQQPGERFYVTLFASESIPKLPHLTHCFGTAIRTVDQGEGRPPHIESHTISWMPATLKIEVLRFRTEKGVNLGLQETLAYALESGQRVSRWGPYECRPELYYRFLVQKEFLDSGRIGYQCVDELGEAAQKGNACDCIHALTDMDPHFSRDHYPLIRFGEEATQYIVSECRRLNLLINPDQTHPWLSTYLGLDSYPIIDRH